MNICLFFLSLLPDLSLQSDDSSKEKLDNVEISDDGEKPKKDNSSDDFTNDDDQLHLKSNIEDSTHTAHSEL